MTKAIKNIIIILIMIFLINYYIIINKKNNSSIFNPSDTYDYIPFIASDIFNIYNSDNLFEIKTLYPDHIVKGEEIFINLSYFEYIEKHNALSCVIKFNYIINEIYLPDCYFNELYKKFVNSKYRKDTNKLDLNNKEFGIKSYEHFIKIMINNYYSNKFINIKREVNNQNRNFNTENYFNNPLFTILNDKEKIFLKNIKIKEFDTKYDEYNNIYYLKLRSKSNYFCEIEITNNLIYSNLISNKIIYNQKWPDLLITNNCE